VTDKDKEPRDDAEDADDAAAAPADDEADGEDADDAKPAKAGKANDDGERMDLPKWNRARVKRKQPKGEEADAFQKSVRKAGKRAIQRAPVVIALIVAVAGAISGVIVVLDGRKEDRAVATRMLAQAVGFQARAQVVDVAQYTKDRTHPFPIPLVNTEEERDQKVQSALAELEAEAPDAPAADAAELVAAARLVREGKFSDAKAAYDAFIAAHPDHELLFLAREGLAFAHESLGDPDAALAELETLMGAQGDFYRDQAMWHRGRILEVQGRGDEALGVYKQYAEEYPLEEASIARQQVVDRLTELAPELVPATPEPAGGPLGAAGLGIGP
jgi:predicted negative regulator of RcsB-dependent stress response